MEHSSDKSSLPNLPEGVSLSPETIMIVTAANQFATAISAASENEKLIEIHSIDAEEKKSRRDFQQRMVFGLAVLFSMIAFFAFCLHEYFTGNEKGIEVLKAFGIPIMTFVGGIITGYASGKLRGKEPD